MWRIPASGGKLGSFLGSSLPGRSLLHPLCPLPAVRVASKAHAKMEKDSLTPSKRKLPKTYKQAQQDPNPLRKDRWFVALMLPEKLTKRVSCVIEDLSQRFQTRVSTACPHITLIPPFDGTESHLEQLKIDLREFSAAQVPVEVQLEGFSAFTKQRVLYVDVTTPGEIVPLHTSLYKALTRSKRFMPRSRGQFHPHVSVASKKVSKKAFAEAWGELQNQDFEGSWVATHLTLLLFENNQRWVEIEKFMFAQEAAT